MRTTASTTTGTTAASRRSGTGSTASCSRSPRWIFPVKSYSIDGNRVSALIPNILPAPDGDDGYYGFDVNTILHYAGNGKWSYEEDVYSPGEADDVVQAWINAGGVIPS